MDAKQLRDGEVKNFFDSVGRHQAIYNLIEERNETTASSSNRTFTTLLPVGFYFLAKWLLDLTGITYKIVNSTTLVTESTTTGSEQGESSDAMDAWMSSIVLNVFELVCLLQS